MEEDCPRTRSWASGTEDHSAEFIAKALGFFWVIGVTESLREFEKLLLFALLGLDAILDEFDEHAVGTKSSSLCQATNLGCRGYRKADALAYGFVCGAHDIIMHQNGAN